MNFTITGTTATGPIQERRRTATELLLVWKQYAIIGLNPIFATDDHGNKITREQLAKLAELENS